MLNHIFCFTGYAFLPYHLSNQRGLIFKLWLPWCLLLYSHKFMTMVSIYGFDVTKSIYYLYIRTTHISNIVVLFLRNSLGFILKQFMFDGCWTFLVETLQGKRNTCHVLWVSVLMPTQQINTFAGVQDKDLGSGNFNTLLNLKELLTHFR